MWRAHASILRPVGPLLGNDRETNNYSIAVTRQLPVNNTRGTVFPVLSEPRYYPTGLQAVSGVQAEVIQNHENANVSNIGQGEPRHKKYKRLKLGGGQPYDR
jgi:hypothetical protein